MILNKQLPRIHNPSWVKYIFYTFFIFLYFLDRTNAEKVRVFDPKYAPSRNGEKVYAALERFGHGSETKIGSASGKSGAVGGGCQASLSNFPQGIFCQAWDHFARVGFRQRSTEQVALAIVTMTAFQKL